MHINKKEKEIGMPVDITATNKPNISSSAKYHSNEIPPVTYVTTPVHRVPDYRQPMLRSGPGLYTF